MAAAYQHISTVEMDELLQHEEAEIPQEHDGRFDRSKFAVRGALLAVLAVALVGASCVSGPRRRVSADANALIAETMTAAIPAGSIKPTENLVDGNVCRDDEELYGTLCYRKCALLTGVTKSIRKDAFSCCNANCDNIFELMSWDTPAILPCTGYDVSSADGTTADGLSCPHEPGACLKNEEQNWGACFKKCSILTHNKYPYRTAATTCCSKNPAFEPLSCINPFETETSIDLAVGGGAGDGDKSTPSTPHLPLKALTESSLTSSV